MRVTLDETGRVAGVKPVEGNPLLTRLSEDAIRKCTFSPTVVDGKPVPVTGILTVAFPPRRQAQNSVDKETFAAARASVPASVSCRREMSLRYSATLEDAILRLQFCRSCPPAADACRY